MMRALLLCLLLAACGGGGGSGGTPDRSAIVFIGDSITARWDLQHYFPGSVNLGVGGETSFQMLARFDTVTALNPKVVVIEAGANDIVTDGGVRGVVSVQAMVTRAAGAKVIVLGLTSTNYTTNTELLRQQIIAFNSELQAMCRTDCIYIDLHAVSTLPDGSLNPDLVVDYIHPNDRFYRLIADALRQHV